MDLVRWSLVLEAGFRLVLPCRGDAAVERSAGHPTAVADPSGSEFPGPGSCSATAGHGSITRLERVLFPIGSDSPSGLDPARLLGGR
jgi:hypothetical protein